MRALDEIPYIWDLVFRVSTRKELKTLCEVCKLFNDLATPILYRSVVLRKSKTTGENWHVLPSDVDDPAKARDLSFSLFYRLLHDDKIRTWTRELTLAKIYDKADLAIVNQKLNHPDEPLADLVKQMPNLGNIYFHGMFPLTQGFLSALNEHKRSPRLHLLNCNWDNIKQDSAPIPFIRTLHVKIPAGRSYYEQEPVEHASILRDVFTAYPKLEDLCLSVSRFEITCANGGRGSFFPRKILKFISPETASGLSEPSLSLDGYILGNEGPFWREQFPWHNLRCLNLGPLDDNPGFLENITGYVQNLTNFSITRFCKHDVMTHTGLDLFLSSFHTLETLTAKGYVPSVHAVGHHPNLKHVCLHAIEHPTRERPVLSVMEIEFLDQSCPILTTLEIDMNTDGIWPGPFIDSLAMGFPNLRQLSVHVELGSRRMELELQLEKQLAQQLFRETRQHLQEQSLERFDDDEFYGNLYDSSDETSGVDREGHDAYREEWQESVLTESNAQAFGNDLFSRRHGPSNLKKITLRTGEKLRHDLGRRNLYSFDEDRFERIFEIYSPPNEGDEPFLKELESEQTRRIRKTSERLDRMFGPCNYVC